MSKGWAGGSTRQWRKTRAAVLRANQDENQGRCMLALPGTWTTRGGVQQCRGVADCVHHTVGKGVSEDPMHMVAACTPCNLRVGEPGREPDPAPAPRTIWTR